MCIDSGAKRKLSSAHFTVYVCCSDYPTSPNNPWIFIQVQGIFTIITDSEIPVYH